ncbi:major facilitator superfamily domain-containing protein [Fusarium solani]|uniref:Major facilitator superfamily domain-containing protein n=1 Tax=Fusarium solani TaxID=169388 RepID=A0A9P9L5K7_FUSSL|nr:major facilitator superfamily domain-containing protein [Fusarium solani]KAH7274648.1 major facilitator superfamily domain-containing protein [Fusarium solani]
MSLNRVQSIETLSVPPGHHHEGRDRRASDASLRVRRLTFNPVPQDYETASLRPDDQHAETVGAFEVPEWKRLLQIAAAVIHCLFAAGIVFGYAAIKPVLKLEGAYSDICKLSHYGDHQSLNSDTNALVDDPHDTCVEIRLNLMFTVAAVGTNVAALPVGAILDHFGPRVCGLLGCFFLAVGALLMANAKQLPFDALLPGYLFLALGGPFTYISSFQLSNAFPRHSGLILALMTGAFDSSSALFLMYRLIYNATNGGFTLHRFFLVYLVVPAVIFVSQLLLMPAQSYKTVGELVGQAAEADEDSLNDEDMGTQIADDQVDEHTALLREERREERERHKAVVHDIENLLGSATGDRQVEAKERQHVASGVWGVLHDRTVLEQIRSPWFILICLFTVVQMTRINFFVATIRPQYEAIFGDHERAVRINTFFDVALPVGGLVSIPFIGTALDHVSTVLVLATLVTCGTLIGILGVIPSDWAAYSGVVLFVLYRPFYYTAVSDYSAKVFGFRTFGTVYGLIICLSGLLNFSQSGLDVLFHETFNGNPVPVDIMLLLLGLVIGASLVAFVAIQLRNMNLKDRARISQ